MNLRYLKNKEIKKSNEKIIKQYDINNITDQNTLIVNNINKYCIGVKYPNYQNTLTNIYGYMEYIRTHSIIKYFNVSINYITSNTITITIRWKYDYYPDEFAISHMIT